MSRLGLVSTLLVGMASILCGCSRSETDDGFETTRKPYAHVFRILSASENKDIEDTIQRAAREAGMEVKLQYMGSVDIMREISKGKACGFDAVWPADSLWLVLGDKSKVVADAKSVMKSPVVFGLKKSIAEKLGWTKNPVKVQDILAAAKMGKFRFAMTSASQSNSGAAAFFGYLAAFAGKTTALSAVDLKDPKVLDGVKELLHQVDRSSGSSGFLTAKFLEEYDSLDGMVNYESQIIEANRKLTEQGREPLYVVYPVNGLVIADYPLGFIDQGDSRKKEFFAKFQAKLLEPTAQSEMMRAGRRPGGIGINIQNADPAVFNPAWGIDANRILGTIPLPSESVIREAIGLYQTVLRKPSLTVFVLDFSGSMAGNGGAEQVKSAMELLLVPAKAEQYFLQPSVKDVNIVVAFNSAGGAEVWRAEGNQAQTLLGLQAKIRSKDPGGETFLFEALARAFEELNGIPNRSRYLQSIILMSDGQPTDSMVAFEQKTGHKLGKDIPVFTIGFGDADERFMRALAQSAGGDYFDGKSGDLATEFRKAKGYN